jgi:SEC-C motif
MPPHDAHFLERLDRVRHDHVELALGLYRDHELVRFVIDHAKVPEGAERIAIALEDGGRGPHLVVARNGHFVTCLGPGMSTSDLPIVSRAHLDGMVARVERVREGVALAKKRGYDDTRLLERIESAGPEVAREDFVAACAVLGPAIPLVFGVFASWAEALEQMHPIALSTRRSGDVAAFRRVSADLVRGAWAMAHAAMIFAQSASREWVQEWSEFPDHPRGSPWTALVGQVAFPFVMRAAWIGARFGKPMLASYKARFANGESPLDVREAGWGLLCMGLRHSSVRAEALKALQHVSPNAPPLVASSHLLLAQAAQLVEQKEDALRAEALELGRKMAILRGERAPAGSPHHYTDPAQVPDDVALPAFFDSWYDSLNGERGADLTLIGVVTAARARAEDFYFSAPALRVLQGEAAERGPALVEMQRALIGTPRTVRSEPKPGRNDLCPCGSGKKYKKCHGA